MLRSAATLFAALAFSATVAAADFSTLEERMSSAEFKAAGLDKLSAAELQQLNGWLQAHGLTKAGAASTGAGRTDDVGFKPKSGLFGDSADGPITSRIKGRFTGWTGSSRFELDNGQVWEQVDGEAFNVKAIENPAVTIAPKMMGSWLLKVDGYNRTTRVTRIR